MFEKLTSIFPELQERFKNPFLFSFLVSWLIINWQVPIGLLFISEEELKRDGFISKLSFISKVVTNRTGIWLPFICACGYTFVFPFFKNLIIAFDAWIKSWGSTLSLKYYKSGIISTERYVNLRTRYFEKEKRLSEIIELESKISDQNKDSQGRIIKLEEENRKNLDIINDFNQKSRLDLFNGQWKMKYRNSDGAIVENRVWISNGDISIRNENANFISLFKILNYSYNPITIEFTWIIESALSQNSLTTTYIVILRPTAVDSLNHLHSVKPQSIVLEIEK